MAHARSQSGGSGRRRQVRRVGVGAVREHRVEGGYPPFDASRRAAIVGCVEVAQPHLPTLAAAQRDLADSPRGRLRVVFRGDLGRRVGGRRALTSAAIIEQLRQPGLCGRRRRQPVAPRSPLVIGGREGEGRGAQRAR